MSRANEPASGNDAWSSMGMVMYTITRPNNALIQYPANKIVVKLSGGDCMLVVTRWNSEGGLMEVCFVVSEDFEKAVRKLEKLARARELQWRPDRFAGQS